MPANHGCLNICFRYIAGIRNHGNKKASQKLRHNFVFLSSLQNLVEASAKCLSEFYKFSQWLGLDRYRYRVSADTRQCWWVSVSADTYFSIGTDTTSPVVRLPVSTVNIVATHAYSFKPIPCFRAYTLHTYITCTHLYPAQNRIFSTKNLYSQVSVSV